MTKTLDIPTWTALRAEHIEHVKKLTSEHLARRRRGERHPVWDFMYTYYPTSPGKLSHWHPGAGFALDLGCKGTAPASQEIDDILPRHKDHYVERDGTWVLDTHRVWEKRGTSIAYMHRLMSLTMNRPPQLNCFGLHEWAMVYKDTPRHPEPLRLGAEASNRVVEAGTLRCSHIDAFRFFTKDAVPLNDKYPTRATQSQMEQPGCLHATMDLYKWTTKLGPLIPGELLLRTFELACDVRKLDMEASPYDLREWGFQPVKIETPSGRAEYVRRQKALSLKGQQLRAEIIDRLEAAFPQLRSANR
ncbi:3-methyladenine DNA glycosylase [Corynebacterium anserum]|uniref:3-methyladenine DNA glycosylase n=1 Tax=Corynebacterium anserum TaxID=2684406 RepID=A0A7G7YNA0_9CORY|nr:3-methyladenine DNA glycosylase [Corynebacterium anserum]MBC2681519.1 3-methyladenine DNA glycosylase [Corynebacterium anserum]QNH95970.1 3-methyladenine DNA glycosylase [Corynebacterium anserum]